MDKMFKATNDKTNLYVKSFSSKNAKCCNAGYHQYPGNIYHLLLTHLSVTSHIVTAPVDIVSDTQYNVTLLHITVSRQGLEESNNVSQVGALRLGKLIHTKLSRYITQHEIRTPLKHCMTEFNLGKKFLLLQSFSKVSKSLQDHQSMRAIASLH